VTSGLKPKVEWVDLKVSSVGELSRLGWRERQWLSVEAPEGPERPGCD
jgi:hypothetical protein